jgi:hypothetical protein
MEKEPGITISALRRGAENLQAKETKIIERDGYWGFLSDNEVFTAVAPVFGSTPKKKEGARRGIEELLKGSPNLRTEIETGWLTLSVGGDGTIYFHRTEKGYKDVFAPSGLSGDALDKWAKGMVADRSAVITKEKAAVSSGDTRQRPSNSRIAVPHLTA